MVRIECSPLDGLDDEEISLQNRSNRRVSMGVSRSAAT